MSSNSICCRNRHSSRPSSSFNNSTRSRSSSSNSHCYACHRRSSSRTSLSSDNSYRCHKQHASSSSISSSYCRKDPTAAVPTTATSLLGCRPSTSEFGASCCTRCRNTGGGVELLVRCRRFVDALAVGRCEFHSVPSVFKKYSARPEYAPVRRFRLFAVTPSSSVHFCHIPLLHHCCLHNAGPGQMSSTQLVAEAAAAAVATASTWCHHTTSPRVPQPTCVSYRSQHNQMLAGQPGVV